MTPRERFFAACACQRLDRPPVWIMRQAGRYLPEYRALKAKHSFVDLVRTPELAHEVTMQPLRRFPLDAAILFSDILVVPEALGIGYRFKDEGGIAMLGRIDGEASLNQLAPASAVREKLAYVPAALRTLRAELADTRALLGFAGSPWTLACYMIEGGGSEEFLRAKTCFHAERDVFERLLELLADAVAEHLLAQIEAGVDAVQIFDSWAGLVPGADYEGASLKWIRHIIAKVEGRVPVIVFARGAAASLPALATCGARVLGLDWTVPLASTAHRLPKDIAVQGNLDPVLLNTTPQIVGLQTRRLLDDMRERPGHIFNLGHGILPQATIENVATMVDTVTSFA
jgi:uroporphyrinogen decarboxylase